MQADAVLANCAGMRARVRVLVNAQSDHDQVLTFSTVTYRDVIERDSGQTVIGLAGMSARRSGAGRCRRTVRFRVGGVVQIQAIQCNGRTTTNSSRSQICFGFSNSQWILSGMSRKLKKNGNAHTHPV
jgi:hypothetical protein